MLSVLVASLALAPSFDSFLANSLGRWRGASYLWQSAVDADDKAKFLPLSVAPGFITTPTASSTQVTEQMRSCGGAVQGVQEERQCQPADGTVVLNRQIDGTTFFSYGSWASAPVYLLDAEESDLLTSPKCFGLSVCVAHADDTRRRLLVVVSDLKNIMCCDVAVEGRVEGSAGAADGEEYPVPDVATSLLEGRLQCVVDANAWEGGATKLTLSGMAQPDRGDWLNARTKWATSEGKVAGGSPLVPAPDDGGAMIEVGSLSVESGEVKVITHDYEADGQGYRLSRVGFEKVEAAAE